jgi:hypothetical protein
MISHKIVHQESNTGVVCDEEEIVGGYKISIGRGISSIQQRG